MVGCACRTPESHSPGEGMLARVTRKADVDDEAKVKRSGATREECFLGRCRVGPAHARPRNLDQLIDGECNSKAMAAGVTLSGPLAKSKTSLMHPALGHDEC